MSTKQYTVDATYMDRYVVKAYENGAIVSEDVIESYDLEGYIKALQNFGFDEAWDVDLCKKRLEEAKLNYDWSKQYPLIKTDGR